MNKAAALEMAETLKAQFDLGNESGNTQMRNRALAKYTRLVEKIGYDPYA